MRIMNGTLDDDNLDNGPGAVFVFIFFSIQGSMGNVLIIVAIVVDKRLRSYNDAFIINVAFMDLIVPSVFFPSVVPLLMAGDNIYPHILCQVKQLTHTSCDRYNNEPTCPVSSITMSQPILCQVKQ